MSNKNGGPNYVKAWRNFRGMTLADLAERVGTNANMIGYLESGERGLSARWLRKLASALDTTPGLLLDHDPNTLDHDVVLYFAQASSQQKRQLGEIAKAILRQDERD